MTKRYKKEELLEKLKEWAKKHGRAPSGIDLRLDKSMPYAKTYYNYFGSFNKAKELAGLETYGYKKEELLEKLKEWAKKHGRAHSGSDLDKDKSVPPSRTYCNHFGTLNKAKKLADLEIFEVDSRMIHLEGLLKEWNEGRRGEISERTRHGYLQDLIILADYLDENNKTMREMTVNDIKNFILEIRDKYSRNTMKHITQAIKNFLRFFFRKSSIEKTEPIYDFAFMEYVNLFFKKQIWRMEDDAIEEEALSEKEIEIIKEKLKKYPFLDVLFRLDLNLALRASEFCKIKITEGKIKNRRDARRNDVWLDLDKGALMIYRGKSRRPHIVALTDEMKELVKKQLILRKLYSVTHEFLFFSKKGKPLKDGSVQAYYREISKITGIKVTSHKVRRTMATILEKRGVPHSLIQKRMGHKAKDVTQHYQRIPIEEKKEILEEKVGVL